MIYFAQFPTGAIKIGHSGDVDMRLRQLEAHYGVPLVLLHTEPGGRPEEDAWHERFAHLRFGRTEQFRPAADLMAAIGRPLLVSSNPDAVESVVPPPTLPSVKLHMDVIEAARIVAAYRNESMTDLLSGMLRPMLAEMESEEIAKRSRGSKRKKRPNEGQD